MALKKRISILALQSRLDRVETTLHQLQTEFSKFAETVERPGMDKGCEKEVLGSIEKIKKGLDKFFTRYASHFEDGECVAQID